jgi:hypothetical protein
MGINADSKSSAHGAVPIIGNSIQPTTSTQSKAAEVGQVHQPRNGNIMATIQDDDDRLLVRIGYTPVSRGRHVRRQRLIRITGFAPSFLQVVYCVIRNIHSWCARIRTSDIRSANVFRRTSYSSMGMVHWQYHGLLYSKFRYITPHRTYVSC